MCTMAEKQESNPSNQETGFCVGSRFCDLRPLGFGGGGTVFSAVDSECDKCVAIKKISLTDQKRCRLALREVRILRKLQHENIVKIYDILHPDVTDSSDPKEIESSPDESTVTNSTSLYLVQELLDTDLQHVIRSGILSKEHTRLFMYQLLRGLKYLHSSNVLHRDLKPSNLLINLEDLVLKIGDFGMARILDPDYCHKGNLTQNVSTRQYRSPELMLHPSNYTKAIDIWAAGCVFAEMLLGKPLFPADHDLEHMMLILEFIPLQDDDLNAILASLPSKMLKNYKGTPRRPLCQLLPDAEPFALDLLQSMLTFDPNQRITAEEAIRHPYLQVYSCTLDEPLHQDPFHIESEVDNLSPPSLRRMIFNENKAVTQSKVVDHAQCNENINIEELDESDDYRLKLELLGISLRDNSDLDSDEEEKLDFANFEKDFEKDVDDNTTTEKSESENSEKTDEDLKENKLLLWQLQELDSRRSSKDVDELELECQEKGVIESSDEECSEKMESQDEKSDDDHEKSDKQGGGNTAEESFSDGRSPSPKEKMDKNEALRRKHRGSRENKEEAETSNKVGPSSDCSEKATGDKLEKEKSEKSVQDDVQVKSDSEESVVIELLDKNTRSDDDDTSSSEISNELSYEKTLEDCLSARSMRGRNFSGTIILDENNLSEDLNNANTLLHPSLLTTTQTLSFKTQVPNSNTSCSSVQTSEENSVKQMATDAILQCTSSTSSNIDEMLYVEIPRPTSVPISTSSKSPIQAVASLHSPRPRASLSPREKSVRPKKQEWFYKYNNKSGHL